MSTRITHLAQGNADNFKNMVLIIYISQIYCHLLQMYHKYYSLTEQISLHI